MAAEPSEENISQVVEFTGCDRDLAVRWLRVKNNNLENAVGAVFDGEDIAAAEQSSGWDETAFTADRQGGPVYGPQAASYNEANLHPLGSSAAPTRGNSPVPSLRQPMTKAQEDEEIEKALANSRQDARYEGQETGVIGANGQTTKSHFGPATQSSYDPSQWAMTFSGTTNTHEASEVIPDLEAHERQYQGEGPRFLKPSPSGDYLPNFLTIAHAIPLAREALLSISSVRATYGEDSEWWRGHEIKLPRIVHAHDGSPAEPTTNEDDEIVAEMQRLNAFMDASSRAYASVENLVRLARHKQSGFDSAAGCLLDQVLWSWESSAATQAHVQAVQLKNVFHSVAGTSHPEGIQRPNLWSLPLSINRDERFPAETVTLAELMDSTLWDTDPDDILSIDAYMEICADILPMRVTQGSPSKPRLGLIVSPVFYVDKYLKENVEITRPIRKQMASTKKRMARLEDLQLKLKTFRDPTTNEQVDAATAVTYAYNHYSGNNRKTVIEENEARGIDLGDQVLVPPPSYAAIAQKLQNICVQVDEKIRILEAEKTKAREALSNLSQSTPSALPSGLQHRYTLRGVSTKPNVTYVLTRRSEDDDDMETIPLINNNDLDAPLGMQWWRIEYDINATGARIHKTPSTEDDVLRAVELEHSEALLVYASDRATTFSPPSQLPPSLQDFVRRDNAHFFTELERETVRVHTTDWTTSPHVGRRGSTDSTAVNIDADAGEDDLPPAYDGMPDEFDGAYADAKGTERFDPPVFGSSQAYGGGPDSPPAHEIVLDDEEGREMVETGGGFLGGGVQGEDTRKDSDGMLVEEERGAHVEDVDARKRKAE